MQGNRILIRVQLLDLQGCFITIDAMSCQRNIARQIVGGGADCLPAVKANQGELHENTKDVFACRQRKGLYDVAHTFQEQVDQGHGGGSGRC